MVEVNFLLCFVVIDEEPAVNNKSGCAAINAVASVSEETSILNYKL